MNKFKSLYDLVANNYEQFTKAELKNIILEVLFFTYSDLGITKKQYQRILAGALFELQDKHNLDIYLHLEDA